MTLPLPFMDRPVGLGEVVATIIHSVFGGSMCTPCEMRASKLNNFLTFVPWSKN